MPDPKPETKKQRSPAYVAAKLHTDLAKAEGAVAKAKAELQTKTEALEKARSELKAQPVEIRSMVLAMGGRKPESEAKSAT